MTSDEFSEVENPDPDMLRERQRELLDDIAEHPPALSKKLSLGRGSAIGRLFALPRKLYDAKGSYSEYSQACYVAKLMKSSPQNTSAAEEILTKAGNPFTVFTPYSKVWKSRAIPLPRPELKRTTKRFPKIHLHCYSVQYSNQAMSIV